MGFFRNRSSSMDSTRAVCGRPSRRDHSYVEGEGESESESESGSWTMDMPTPFGTIACDDGSLFSSPTSPVASSWGSDLADCGHHHEPKLTSEKLARCFGKQGRSSRKAAAATKAKLNLMDLPTELHLEIVEICLELKGWGDNHRGNRDKKYIGGAVRELTLVNRYFRDLTALYLFKRICINDKTEATMKDLLKESMQAIMTSHRTYQWLPKLEKFTVSLTRTPQPNHQYVEEDLILILDLVRPKTQRFVIESPSSQWHLLCLVENIWTRWAASGVPHRIYNTRQLEISAPLGHNWDFQFLASPYVNVERMWLDYNCDLLEPDTLNLSRLPLKYLMLRSFPPSFPHGASDLASFRGWSEDEAASARGGQAPRLAAMARTLPQLKHLALCGLLSGPVADIAARLAPMRSLQQLDITDQQAVCARQVMDARCGVHPDDATDWAMTHSHLLRWHPHNTGRAAAAAVFFEALPSLERVCFVRDQVGTVYHAVRGAGKDEGGGRVLLRVEPRETITAPRRYLRFQSPKAWLCGFPNVLGYELFDGREPSYIDTIRSEETFWL